MDKQRVFDAVLERLVEELRLRRQAAESARTEATDEESRSEGKYDTRGLEASYLARGHALSIADLEADLATLRSLTLPAGDDSVAGPGQLIEVSIAGQPEWYFILPCAGGREIVMEGHTVTVVTPSSPMGQKLGGLRQGASFPLRPGMPPGRVTGVF
jgi:hypothetical protein